MRNFLIPPMDWEILLSPVYLVLGTSMPIYSILKIPYMKLNIFFNILGISIQIVFKLSTQFIYFLIFLIWIIKWCWPYEHSLYIFEFFRHWIQIMLKLSLQLCTLSNFRGMHFQIVLKLLTKFTHFINLWTLMISLIRNWIP